MLLHNITDSDITAVLGDVDGANQVNSDTEMVGNRRKVADVTTISAIVAGLAADSTPDSLSQEDVRLTIFGALYSFGCFESAIETRFPFATVNEAEKNNNLISEFQVIPGSKRVIALRKSDGKEYRKGNPELKGKKAPNKKWNSVADCVRVNTNGAVAIIRKAAKIASARIREENADVKPVKAKAPAKKTAPKKKAPPKRKQKVSSPA